MVRHGVEQGSALIFDPGQCALCGSPDRTAVVELPPPSLTSDGRAVDRRLYKVACSECGLVRNGDAYSEGDLDEHYGVSYDLARRGARAEPLVFGDSAPVPRGRALAQWVADAVAVPPRSVLEVGCGEGSVLAWLRELWPQAKLRGVDMSADAVSAARARGLDVEVASYDQASGQYDVVFSVAVIEHVPSPLDYLQRLADRLAPDGVIVSIQPNQDDPSIDVFFSDHLHHFTTAHIEAFGGRAGLRELSRDAGHPALPTFSRHVFERGTTTVEMPRTSGAVAEAVAMWNGVFGQVDDWLRGVAGGHRLALWGAGQTSDALATYTGLGDRGVDAVLDDNPERFVDGWRGSSVTTIEASEVEGREWAVLFTFRPPAPVIARLESRNVDCYYCAI